MRNWVLPEYIEDILPPEAARIERLRRAILDLFVVHGFELVMPPMIEHLESLLTGTGHDLDLQTFKLVDQLSGRMLGVRADIAPQVARIDAHLLNRAGVTRLCYTGSVLQTLPRGMNRTREPLQIGAELYGHAGIESDAEIQRLMMKALTVAGVREAYLDIGHVAIFRCLVRRAGLDPEREGELFRAMQSKDVPALKTLARKLDRRTGEALVALPELYGGPEVLAAARRKAARARRDPRRARRARGAVAGALRRGAHPLLRPRGAARLPLPQRRRVRGLRRRLGQRARAGRPLRRSGQGVRTRPPGDRLQHGPARAGAGGAGGRRALGRARAARAARRAPRARRRARCARGASW